MNLLLAELRRLTSRRIFKIPVMVFFGLLTIGLILTVVSALFVEKDPRSLHRSEVPDIDLIFAPFNFWLALLAVVIGSSSLGAEFGAASLSTQLLFEPRRIRVLLTKAAALVLCYAAFMVVFLSITAALNISEVDEPGGTSWPRVIADGSQIVGVSSLFALIAFSITAFTRKTAGAVFALFGVFLTEVLFLARFEWVRPRLPIMRLISIVAFSSGTDTFGESVQVDLVAAFVVGTIWTAVFLGAATWYFSKAEIR